MSTPVPVSPSDTQMPSMKEMINFLCTTSESQHEQGQKICPMCDAKERTDSNDNQPASAGPTTSEPNKSTNNEDANQRSTVSVDSKEDRVKVPAVVREQIGLTNCLISYVTLSKMSDTRYIVKDYFIGKDQKRNDTVRNKDEKEWDRLYDEVMKAIEAGIVLTMVRKAQKVGLTVKRGKSTNLVSS